MGLNAAVQALKKAEPLKDKVQRCKDLLNDNDAWVCQQQLQKIYQQVLILDLEYALDRKVEQELWNLGFKNYIATLQSQAKDRKNPKRGESQALLSWCLEAASGFYLTLLQEICTAFDLDLPFRRKGYVYGCTSPWKAVEKLSVPHKSSCFYACQYCLVHLGDIARYRNENKQAELFYRHAVSLSPSSGQPYNQLALLEASRGNKLGTVFHYARSVAVKHPFPVATTNLAKTLSSALNDHSFNIEEKAKLTSHEYIAVFLKLHGVIHNFGDPKIAASYVKLLTETLTALIATESFTSWMLVQMLVINLYALEHTAGIGTESSADPSRNEELTAEERIARDCILDLIAGSLSALLLPVYTIKNSIIEYFALPSIKLCLDWIHTKPTVLEELAFTSRLQIWPSLCVLLNALQACVLDFAHDQYVKVPLPEDRDLQGFLPLEKSFESLKFTSTDLECDLETTNKLRAVRIVQLGHSLAQCRINGAALIAVKLGEKSGDNTFSSVSEAGGLSNELIKELEELSLNKERQPIVSGSPVLSESASSKGSVDADIIDGSLDKRMGILKPQGSLERSRDLTVNNTECCNLETNCAPTNRKPRQNIAMQAIMRRAETEQKQVTFKNVSPVIMEEDNEKKGKTPAISPAKTIANKNVPVIGEPQPVTTNNTGAVNASLPITTPPQNRPALMPFAASGVQQQSTLVSTQPQGGKLGKLQHGNVTTIPNQINQLPSKEQQISGMLAPMSSISQCVGTVCYPNQSFNVQNPQFTKNFLANHIGNIPGYQMQNQLSSPTPPIPQNVGLQHNLNQTRSLHQRVVHNVGQNSMLHQNVGLSSPGQQSMMPPGVSSQSINSQQPGMTGNAGLQQTLGVQSQPNHGLAMQQQNAGKNNLRPSGGISSHNQIALNASGLGGAISTLPTNLNTYQKNLHQATSIVPNVSSTSLSPTSMANFPLNFNQSNFSQSTFGQMAQKQLPASVYNKSSDVLEFPFPNQNLPKNQQPQHAANSYPLFPNYESAPDFNLWKTTAQQPQQPQQPQLPVPCWGSAPANPQMRTNDTATVNNYQNWEDPSNPGKTIGRSILPAAMPANTYQTDQQHNRHFTGSNTFEESSRPSNIEMDLQTAQSVTTGNTYSLFSGNSWGSNLQACNTSNQDQVKTRINQQSLWSGPGPSPLERLLEQQKSLREGGT